MMASFLAHENLPVKFNCNSLLIRKLFRSTDTEEIQKEIEQSGIDNWGLSFGIGVEHYKNPHIVEASINGEDRIVILQDKYDTKPSA